MRISVAKIITLNEETIITGGILKQKEIFKDRKRTNIFKSAEQSVIYYLVKRIPLFVTPNILTGIGLAGSVLVFLSFILSAYINPYFLLLGIAGLVINWFGDSLDGRIAYYRNIPRKWYGYSLDIIMDWFSVIFTGLGYYIFSKDGYEIIAFAFVISYGWAMIISQIRYKITDKYSIDSGIFGPTELRVIVAFIFLLEVLVPGSINFCVGIVCLIFLILNILDTNKLLDLGNLRDNAEKASKKQSIE